MNFKKLSIIPLLVFAVLASAQPKPKCDVTLSLFGGPSYAALRDLGTSPIVYDGLQLQEGLAVKVDLQYWSFSGIISGRGGAYTSRLLPLKKASFSIYGGSLDFALRADRLLWRSLSDCWHLSVGASLDNYTSLFNASRYMNASFSLNDFLLPNFHLRMEYTIPDNESIAKLGGWFSAHAEVSLSPFGLAYRPGFSYLDNFTSTTSRTDYLFSSYQCLFTWLPALSSNIGVHFNLRTGNRIGISYQWDYLTSRNCGFYRYDDASHFILVDFQILLKR